MPLNFPFFTIIVPTYNRAHLISKTLQTILDQTFQDFEVVVVDDGSIDDTENVVQAFNSEKLKYYRKENEERGAARNFGWQKAKGQFITFLDSDDILYPVHLQTAFSFLKLNNDAKCMAQGYEIKEAKTNKILVNSYKSTSNTINKEVVKGNFLSCFGVFIKRDIINEVRFEEDRKFAGSEDWLLWLQLAARYPFFYSNSVTGALLEHDSRSVLSFKEESLIYRAKLLKQRLETDAEFSKKFGHTTIKHIYAHMLSYTSLHLAMSKMKNKAIHYWLKALSFNNKELFSRRSLAIIKKVVFS